MDKNETMISAIIFAVAETAGLKPEDVLKNITKLNSIKWTTSLIVEMAKQEEKKEK